MVTEVAKLAITEGREEEFERAFGQGKAILASSPGFVGAELHRGIERPNEYWLLVRWETLEAHMVDFRESERFVRWREVVGPYFAAPPDVTHVEQTEIVPRPA